MSTTFRFAGPAQSTRVPCERLRIKFEVIQTNVDKGHEQEVSTWTTSTEVCPGTS